MLSAAHRLRDVNDFRFVMRQGARAGRRTVVIHARCELTDEPTVGNVPVRVGFVVSKAVGNAVTRNLVKRRLRHIMKNWLDAQRGHTATSYLEGDVVVRALPASAQATYTQLNDDVKSALHSAIMAG